MFASKLRVHARRVLTTLSAGTVMLLSACGGSMSGNSMGATGGVSTPASCNSSSCAPAVLTMTDAKGDFLSYIVTLTSLQLQTAAGVSVETLPVATKVDFSQLVDLAEIISAGQIPAAEYVSATLTLDTPARTLPPMTAPARPLR